jgi:hypothetical protein
VTTDEQYVQELRARFTAAAPVILVDPGRVVRRGRRRRAVARGAGAAAVLLVALVVVVGAWRPDGGGGPVTAPPAEPSSAVSLWMSADRVPTGPVEMVTVLRNHSDAEAVFGVLAEVDRWDGARWRPFGWVALCQDHWQCTARVETGGDRGAADIGILAPPGKAGAAERFTTEGLEPGWYRMSRVANEGVVATGVFEVTDSAPRPAPLWPLDEPAVVVQPALLPPGGGRLVLSPSVPPSADGSLSAEDVAAVVDGLLLVADVERWTGDDWEPVTTVELEAPDREPSFFEVVADVGPLEPGAYRLVRIDPDRTGRDAEQDGRFWVTGP